jgi:hypothetical protein
MLFSSLDVLDTHQLAMAAAIPLELHRPIVEYMDSLRDMCAVARVCRSLQLEAERLIYRTLAPLSFVETVALCKRVTLHPRFGSYVLSLCINGTQLEINREAFKRIVSSTLERMPKLQHLTIYVPHDENPANASSWLSWSNFNFKLRSFETSLTLDGSLLSFLDDQAELRAIKLWRSEDANMNIPSQFSASFLPKLAVLECEYIGCDPQFPASIISHRPVTHVATSSLQPLLSPQTPQSTGSIEALKVDHCRHHMPGFDSLPDLLPDLRLFSGIVVDNSPVRGHQYHAFSYLTDTCL